MSASKHQLAASAYHLKPADVQKLLLQANNFRDRCLIKTLWWLGVRRSELINLDVRDFDKKRKRMTVRKGKGSKTRVIPLINDEYLSDLLLLIGSRKTGPIFLIQASDDYASFLRYPLVRCLTRGGGQRCGRFG